MSEQTNLTNPPSDQTKNVKPASKEKPKMLKVKCLRDFVLDRPGGQVFVKPGQTIEVTREEARHLVKHGFKSNCQFSGERWFGDNNTPSSEAIKASSGMIYKAELVKEPVLEEEDQAS